MKKAVFYHAGCPVCVTAEQQFIQAMESRKFTIEVIHLGVDKNRIGEAEQAGVKSVPALVVDGTPFHINYGASLADLKS